MINERPWIITAICIMGFLGALLAIPMMSSDIAQQRGTWFPPYLAFTIVIGLICMVGLWTMKKWGIITYAVFVGINQIVLIAIGGWNIFSLIIPGIVVVIGFSKYKLMK